MKKKFWECCASVYTFNLKNKRGISLMALVITIIISLILAGISILALSKNGLIEKALSAKNKSKNEQNEENIILSEYEEKISDYIVDGTRTDSTNVVSNINIYIDGVKSETIPEKNSKYIYTYYTSNNNDTTIEFDREKWSINIYNITDDKTQFNVYFCEKDKLEVLLKLLNISEKYNTAKELYEDKLQEILNNTIAYDYIIYSNGNLAQELSQIMDEGQYTKSTFNAYTDGLNSHSLKLNSGRYIIKFSCNMSFELRELLADEVIALKDNMYIVKVTNQIKFNWYCNHYGIAKYLYVEYKKF